MCSREFFTNLFTHLAIVLMLILFPLERDSFSDWVILPESHHQRYEALGLFFDEQSVLVNYGQARLWTALGGTVPILGNSDSPHHPELVIHASANAALHYNDNFRLWTETLDVRLGFAYEWELNPQLRFSIGYQHFSGHAVDGLNTADSDLMEPTIGQEFVPIRAVYDFDRMVRVGATVLPVVRTAPPIKRLWANQFVEYYPWHAQESPRRPSPYIALSFEQSGADTYVFTYNAQVGVLFGDHFGDRHQQDFRVVLGYYSGADPRLKYFELRNATMSFAYLGLMFDI